MSSTRAEGAPGGLGAKLLALVVATGVSLGLSEAVLRAIDFQPRGANRDMFVNTGRALLPHTLTPGFDGLYTGQRVRVDADGRRVVAVRPEHAANAEAWARGESPRASVLLLGDSVVFGQGLPNDETIASQLQNLLLDRGYGVRVQNIGVPGYTSWNEYAALSDFFGAGGHADAVVVVYIPNDVTLENDHLRMAEDAYAVPPSAFHRLTSFLYQRVYTLYLVREALVSLRDLFRGEARELTDFLDPEALAYSMEALSRMAAACEERGIRFSVGVYRDTWHYADAERSLEYEAAIFAGLAAEGIEGFRLESHIRELSLREVRVFWNDAHPGERASGFIARDIFRHLEPWLREGEPTPATRAGLNLPTPTTP